MQAVWAVFGDSVVTHGTAYSTLCRQLGVRYKSWEWPRSTDKTMNSTGFGMLDGLAFVPLADVKVAMHYLRTVMPPSVAALVEYCDDNSFREFLGTSDGNLLKR